MMKLILISFFFGNTVSFAEILPLNAELGGVKSAYTDFVLKTATESQKAEPDFQLKCHENPNNDLYLGIEQRVRINAPLNVVESVLNDIDQFKDLFPGYKDVHIVSKNENRWLTYWEQRVPVFFIPNVKYQMIYLIDRSTPGKVVYRYQLEKSGTLKASDGFISIQKVDDQHTDFVEYDFFDAEWGAAKILGKSKIWNDAVEGIYHSDLATKLKAENETWSHEKAREEAQRIIKKDLVKECIEKKEKVAL